ncbi:MAG: hypothetical protein EOP54_15800 [Sphingobacteriales bacterium]|nr:MAG: hypothetical protein EOP54_15800 [Sphingobacteriales bacterium]
MNNITHTFGTLYHPCKALLIYRKTENGYNPDYYVESYDMDSSGKPVNPHPLTIKESHALAKSLQSREKKAHAFLTPKGLLPPNLLYLKSGNDGFAVWHTAAQKAKLLFSDGLGIPSGEAAIPALVWKAIPFEFSVCCFS